MVGDLREIALPMANELLQTGVSLIPGHKICPTCRNQITSLIENNAEDDSNNKNSPEIEHEILLIQSDKDTLNVTLNELELTPLKTHAISSISKVNHGKRKLVQLNESLSKRVASVLQTDQEILTRVETNSSMSKDIQNIVDDLDKLVNHMKEKLKISN